MGTAIIIVILAAAVIFGVKSYIGKLSRGCCGAQDAEKKVKVSDTELSHYPYSAEMTVTGMTCSRCKERVENALNRIDGIWAEADLKTGIALVHMKNQTDETELRRAVIGAGYGVSSVKML